MKHHTEEQRRKWREAKRRRRLERAVFTAHEKVEATLSPDVFTVDDMPARRIYPATLFSDDFFEVTKTPVNPVVAAFERDAAAILKRHYEGRRK